MAPYLAVLRIKSFRNLWLAQIASQLAVNVMAFVLTIQVYELTKSNTAVSLLVLAIGLPALLLGSIAGVFVDWWDKRTVLIWCNILRAIIVGCLFFLREALPVVYTSAILISLITQFFIPAEAPLIPEFVGEGQLLSANSLFSFTYYASVAAGFVGSGPLLRIFGAQGIFLFISFFLLMAAYFAYSIPHEKKKIAITALSFTFSKIGSELRYGFLYLQGKKRILEALLLFTGAQAFLTTIAALAPGFADRVLLIDLTDASVIVMGPAVTGLILGALFLGVLSRRFSQKTLISSGIIGTGVVLLVLSLFIRVGNRPDLMFSVERLVPLSFQLERLDVAVGLFFLLGIFNSIIIVPLNTILQRETEENVRGRVYGILSALSGGVTILPVVGAGSLADTIGVGKTIFSLSVAVLLFGSLRLVKARVKVG